MKLSRFLLSAAGLAIINLSLVVPAYADLTGAWSGTTLGTYENHFNLLQRGNNVVGSAVANKSPGVIKGTLSGNTFTFNSGYGKLKYSSNAQATISGDTMTGTFLDSQGTSGGFVAYKDETVLRNSTILYSPPIVEVKGNKAKVTAIQFTEVADPANPTGPQDGLKISYSLKLTGAASRAISSKSNKYTFDNLPSGKFKVVSFMTATRNGKKLFTIAKSPGANFTIK